MNRELKFRVWDGEQMIYNSNLGEYDDYYWMSLEGEFFGHTRTGDAYFEYDKDETNKKNYTLMQYTGLKDKNGKEIYEGDILSYKSAHLKHEGKIFNNVVEFATGQSLCGWRMRNKSCVVKATPYKFIISEIIGNIYENTELLETKNVQISERKVE